MNIERDFEIERFRLRVRRDYAHRDEDQQQVNVQRLRVRVSRDFIMGNADSCDEPIVAEGES
jgi:hypothetical protein